MNQKQRDYLIKRLETIKNEKIAGFHIDEPNPEPFIKMLKEADILPIIQKINKGFSEGWNTKEGGCYVDVGKRYREYRDGTKIVGFKVASHVQIEKNEYFTNLSKIQEKYREHCKKHYQIVTDRHKSIEKKYVEMCDQIVFAEDYGDAMKLIKEFLKF